MSLVKLVKAGSDDLSNFLFFGGNLQCCIAIDENYHKIS